jgi:hypothetical protein
VSRRPARSQIIDLRERLAQESARLMIEHGIVDFGLAKRKAAERLAVANLGALPSNAQIESCLVERQRIFAAEETSARVHRLRLLALDLMQVLRIFEPRLVGPVLAGTATINSNIEVHLFSASIESVAEILNGSGFGASHCERRYRFGGGRVASYPGIRVSIEGEQAVLPVFPEHGLREAPLSSIDQRTMERASIRRVAEIVAG